MFDLRYHVASLTAVFLALVIGVLVGVGLSGRGFVDDAERTNLNNQIEDLRAERDAASELADEAGRRASAMDELAASTYPLLVVGRLDGATVAILYAGEVDRTVDFAVRQAVRDAGGRVVRSRAIEVPVAADAVTRAFAEEPALAVYAGEGGFERLGSDLAQDLVGGGSTTRWERAAAALVVEQDGPAAGPVDAVVVARTAPPQSGRTQELLSGIYRGLATSGVPAVGVEATGAEPSAVPVFQGHRLSTVDDVESSAGRLALVLLLAGAQPGSYGVAATARDGVLPPFPPAG